MGLERILRYAKIIGLLLICNPNQNHSLGKIRIFLRIGEFLASFTGSLIVETV